MGLGEGCEEENGGGVTRGRAFGTRHSEVCVRGVVHGFSLDKSVIVLGLTSFHNWTAVCGDSVLHLSLGPAAFLEGLWTAVSVHLRLRG